MADAGPAEVEAAGAVLWRPARDSRLGTEIALVHRPRYDDWAFPKGKRLPGEPVLLTAVREVEEETGLRASIGRRLRPTCYLVEGRSKRVDYWAARHTGGAEFVPNSEVDQMIWLPAGAARDRLSYAHDVAVLDDFTAGPAASVPIIVLRHASAVSKNGWWEAGHRDDLPRPLTGRGRAQAAQLADLLGCYPPARVISSPAERCLATVRPYAASIGVTVQAEPLLAPDGPAAASAAVQRSSGLDPARGPAAAQAISAQRLLAQWVAGPEPVVMCGHRENLPTVLAWLCALFGAPSPGGPGLRKGEFWALAVGEGRLLSAERHRAERR